VQQVKIWRASEGCTQCLEPWLSAPCGNCHFYMIFSLLNSWYVCILVSGNKIDVNRNSGLCFECNVLPCGRHQLVQSADIFHWGSFSLTYFAILSIRSSTFSYQPIGFFDTKLLIQWRNHRCPCILKFCETVNLVNLVYVENRRKIYGFFSANKTFCDVFSKVQDPFVPQFSVWSQTLS
jgi:hypothetical protein